MGRPPVRSAPSRTSGHRKAIIRATASVLTRWNQSSASYASSLKKAVTVNRTVTMYPAA
ncbi:hypothetical protein [Nonomuraea ceibae]|uniref:hypothetical protein n=1 Tax=Nonomuraea ceibae TaxID=1935170 RepID=UPI001C5EDB53|nr:hypothetical protein [Nonomuraea ceibae]